MKYVGDIKEKIKVIDIVLQKLDSTDRHLIEMFYMKNVTADDVGTFLHINRSTVYRRANNIINEIAYCFIDIFK